MTYQGAQLFYRDDFHKTFGLVIILMSKDKEYKIGRTAKEDDNIREKVKFEIYGEEMVEKLVKSSGNSGRIYLPPNWIGRRVKIIRIN